MFLISFVNCLLQEQVKFPFLTHSFPMESRHATRHIAFEVAGKHLKSCTILKMRCPNKLNCWATDHDRILWDIPEMLAQPKSIQIIYPVLLPKRRDSDFCAIVIYESYPYVF